MMVPATNNSVQMQLVWNRLLAVVEEQAQVLIRTAFSPIVRACGDVSVGVFDLKGRMLAQAVTGTPGHVNTMAESVKHFIEAFPISTMHEGDVFITNDPWMGTGHLNDFVVVTPCFFGGECVALFSCTSHLMDIGGLGTGTEAPDVYAEGLHIPLIRLFDAGSINETLIAMIRANSRLPVDTVGDTYALAACNDVGVKRLTDTFAEFSLRRIDEVADYIVETSSRAVRNEISRLPKGTWRNEMMVDGYNEPLKLCAALTVTDDEILVDFEGSAAAVVKGINVPLTYTAAYSAFGISCALASGIPNNAGSLGRIKISAPSGTIVNAVKPSPVAMRHTIGHMLADLLFGCFTQCIPERVPAEGASCMWNISIRGRHVSGDQMGQAYSHSVTTSGGTGARYTLDGLSATAFPTGVHCIPIEITETQVPVLFWRKELRADSAGAGRNRGGMGQIIEFVRSDDEPFRLNAAFERIKNPASGRLGGLAGCPGFVGLASGQVLPGKGVHDIAAGERVVMHTPGGGGTGPVADRDRDLIIRDLLEGRISKSAAHEIYGYEP